MANPLRAEAEKALGALQAALDAVERGRLGAAGPAASPAADCLAAAAQRVSQEVAKCAVMFGTGGLGRDDAASLLGALCAAVRAFAAQCGAVAATGGATLRVRSSPASQHTSRLARGRLALIWRYSLPTECTVSPLATRDWALGCPVPGCQECCSVTSLKLGRLPAQRETANASQNRAVAQADVCAVAAGVVGACSTFVRAAALEGVRDGALRQKAGAAMERCAAAERAPLDDRTALSRAIMQARDVPILRAHVLSFYKLCSQYLCMPRRPVP